MFTIWNVYIPNGKHLFNGQFSRTLVNAKDGKVLNNIEQIGIKLGSDKSFKF